MTKIRCSDGFGVDLDQVTTWVKSTQPDKRKFINLSLAGADDPVTVYEDVAGCQAFAYLHKLLIDRFAIDLASKNNLPRGEKDDIDDSLLEELVDDLPY
jgi:hypothetical protein